MKLLTLAALALCASGLTAQAQTQSAAPDTKSMMPPPIKADKTRNVAFLIYDGVEPLDLSGALDVFVKANHVTGGGYHVYTVGLTHDMVQTQLGTFGVTPKFALADAPKPDIIIVPGALTERAIEVGQDARVQSWLRANAQDDQTVLSVCTGAFVVGGAGLFDGKDATTHFMSVDKFVALFPRAKTWKGARYIGDGNVFSSGGVTSGIDGALHLVERFSGKEAAERVARVLQYRRDQPVFPAADKTRAEAPAAPIQPVALAQDTDPICKMKVSVDTPYTATYNGQTYGFCSADCRDKFLTSHR